MKRFACGRNGDTDLSFLHCYSCVNKNHGEKGTEQDYISGITIGALTANVALNPKISLLNGFLALAVWSALTIIIDFWNIKSKRFRKLVTGDAVIVIKNGVIVEDALRKVRLDIDSLRSLLRKKNVFSVADVAFAVFETDGKLSVLKKENKQTVTNESLNPAFVPVNPDFLPTEVISDGTVNQKNIKKLNLRENWITHQIKNAGLSSVSDVFYAELQKDGTLFIDHKKQPSPS